MPNSTTTNRYKRILLKVSGEHLDSDDGSTSIDINVLEQLTQAIEQLISIGVQVGLVIGGGNFLRGSALSAAGMDRVAGDYMGMLATIINGIAMRDALERSKISTRLLSAIPVSGIVEHYNYRNALRYLQANEVVIFSAGTGNPFFSTDSAACLRAIEIDADIVIKATSVDGVYSADPKINQDATIYKNLSYDDFIAKKLAVMDMTAVCLARDYKLPIRVLNINDNQALLNLMQHQDIGTLISG
jgi:uridylate kinase